MLSKPSRSPTPSAGPAALAARSASPDGWIPRSSVATKSWPSSRAPMHRSATSMHAGSSRCPAGRGSARRGSPAGVCGGRPRAGAAVIGKTRLADEFVRRTAVDARVLIGRCLSYGEGITYWPIAEAIRAEAGIHDEDDADDVRHALLPLVPESPDRDRIVTGIADILGVGNTQLTEGEALWSVRRFFDGLASTATVVLVIEDVHWAEPTLLDLVHRLIDWMRDTPLLVVCTARPDIFERTTGWGARPEGTTLTLRPLSRAAADPAAAVARRRRSADREPRSPPDAGRRRQGAHRVGG